MATCSLACKEQENEYSSFLGRITRCLIEILSKPVYFPASQVHNCVCVCVSVCVFTCTSELRSRHVGCESVISNLNFQRKKELLETFHFSLSQGFPSVQFSHSVVSDSATHGLQHDRLPRRRSGKESACQCRRCKRHKFNPWVGKMPWRRAWGPTQYSCLENPMDRGAWLAAIHGVAESQND